MEKSSNMIQETVLKPELGIMVIYAKKVPVTQYEPTVSPPTTAMRYGNPAGHSFDPIGDFGH